MSSCKYNSDLYAIDDYNRRVKYQKLLLLSLTNDLLKWTVQVTTVSVTDRMVYSSPLYGSSSFCVECRGLLIFAYVKHKGTPPIQNKQSELISDDFSKDLQAAVKTLTETIYTNEIYEIEKLVGTQNGRKEKLQFIDLEKIKELVEDTYQDWVDNESEICAKLIAKIIYSYRRKEEPYKAWLEKFNDVELVIEELEKLKG
jgi:hypothetical protein